MSSDFNGFEWLVPTPYIKIKDPQSGVTIAVEGDVDPQPYVVRVYLKDISLYRYTLDRNDEKKEDHWRRAVKIQQLCKAFCVKNDCIIQSMDRIPEIKCLDIVFTPRALLKRTYSFRVIFDLLVWSDPAVGIRYFEKFRLVKTGSPTYAAAEQFETAEAAADAIYARLGNGLASRLDPNVLEAYLDVVLLEEMSA